MADEEEQLLELLLNGIQCADEFCLYAKNASKKKGTKNGYSLIQGFISGGIDIS